MRRCLQTIMPGVQQLAWSSDHCFCHGGAFEHGCAGLDFKGTPRAEIEREFPEFQTVEFTASGGWNYLGSSGKETSVEFVLRVTKFLQWLQTEAVQALRDQGKPGLPTIILSTHQTMADLLLLLLLEGSAGAERWEYGNIRYKLENASLSELSVFSDGRAKPVTISGSSHLITI